MPGMIDLFKPAVRTMGRIGGRSALTLGAATLGLAPALGVAAMGAAYGLNRIATTVGGGKVFEPTHHHLGAIRTPTVAGTLVKRGLYPGAAMLGAAQGAYQAMGGSGWNVHQALSTGALEVERPHFLGATGSLTISSSRRRRSAAAEGGNMNYSRMIGLYGDDVLHMLHGAVG